MARRKPFFEQSTTRPWRSSFGAKAMECRHRSRRPQFLGDGLEHGLELALLGQVERQQQRCIDLSRQRLHVGARLVVEVGDRDIGAERLEGLGTTPGNGLVVSNPRDQRLLALQQGQRRDNQSCCVLLRARAGASAHYTQRVVCDHKLLVGRNDVAGNPGLRSRDAGLAPSIGIEGRAPSPAMSAVAPPLHERQARSLRRQP